MAGPRKGKASLKITKDGKRVSYGQKGASVKPGTSKGDSYCARSMAQMKIHKKAASNPNSPLRLSRKKWRCSGSSSRR